LLCSISFIRSSYNCLCFFTITSKIIPVIHNNKAISKEIPDTIKLGNLGTNPVSKYSKNTGTPKIKEISKKILANSPKKIPGLYSLNSVAIVFNTLNQSLYVFNFDTLHAGLSRYVTGISTSL